jgi:hypothetical protein
MRATTFAIPALAIVLGGVLAGSGAALGAKPIKPKAGAYAGKVTSGNGRGEMRFTVAKYTPSSGGKPKSGPRLFEWIALLRCNDGSTLEAGPAVFAPLRGLKFNGRAATTDQTVTLTGRFTTATRLEGTVRVVRTGATPHEQCDSGPVKFAAKHG